MRRLLLIMSLLMATGAGAQIKSFSQLVSVSTYTIGALKSYGEKQGWKVHEDGKMDSLLYTRVIPGQMNSDNASDCIMCFYKNKQSKFGYIVFQTANKKTFDKYFSEMTKSGYVRRGGEEKGDELKALYVKGHYFISVTKGRPTPKDPLVYMLGVRIEK